MSELRKDFLKIQLEKAMADKQLVEKELEHEKLVITSVGLSEVEYNEDDEFFNDVLKGLDANEIEAEEQERCFELESIEINKELKAKAQAMEYREIMDEILIPDENVEEPDFWIEDIPEDEPDEVYLYDYELFVDEDPTVDEELLAEMEKYRAKFDGSKMFVEEEKPTFEAPDVSWDDICES